MARSGLFHGSRFNRERFKREITAKVLELADERIRAELKRIRCPDHGTTAIVKRTAKGWDIHGCCDKLTALVRRQLQ